MARDQIAQWIAQARELEGRRDFAESIAVYSNALARMSLDDPRRAGVESAVEFLQQQLPGEAATASGIGPEESASTPPAAAEPPPPCRMRPVPANRVAWVWRTIGCAGLVLVGLLELAAFFGLQTRFIGPSRVSLAQTPPPPALTALASPPALVPVTPAAAPSLSHSQKETPILESPPTLNVLPPSILTPLAITSPTPAPTPADGNLTAHLIFQQVFDLKRLDESKWNYDNQRGTLLEWSHHTMRVYSSAARDAYVSSRSDAFPTSGPFDASIDFRYFRQGQCRAAVGMATFLPPAGSNTPPPPQANEVSIWFGHDAAHFSDDLESQDIAVPDLGTDWHVVSVRYIQDEYVLRIDGKAVFTSRPTGARPQFIWFGNPADLGQGHPCEWDTLEIQKAQVDALAQQ